MGQDQQLSRHFALGDHLFPIFFLLSEARLQTQGHPAAALSSETQTLDDRIFKPYGVRAERRISLSECQPNRVQAIMIHPSPPVFFYLPSPQAVEHAPDSIEKYAAWVNAYIQLA